MEILIGTVFGGLVSWALSHWYYKRSVKTIPDWVQPLLNKLPDAPVSVERLVELYNEARSDGRLDPDAWSSLIKCPHCKAPSAQFKHFDAEVEGDDSGFLSVGCKQCGREVWRNDGEPLRSGPVPY